MVGPALPGAAAGSCGHHGMWQAGGYMAKDVKEQHSAVPGNTHVGACLQRELPKNRSF